LCLAYAIGKVIVVSRECVSHIRPFAPQFIINAEGFFERGTMKPQITFVFIVYALIFKPELVYLQNTQTGHKRPENKPLLNVYFSVETTINCWVEEIKKMQNYAHIYLLKYV
jgi:hypothetical protein